MASRYPFPAAPDGWYAVARSDELGAAPLALHYFARELEAVRAEDGAPCVRSAGRTLPSCEANGFVYAWWHALSVPASYPVAVLRDGPKDWTPWRTSAHVVRVHVQDMTENILDRAHFTSVHDMALPERARFDVRFEGVSLVVDQLMSVTALHAAGVEVRSLTRTCGPGLVAVEVTQGPLDTLTYITQTPIDEERCDVRLHFSMRALPDARATERVAELNQRITLAQFEQDVPIWEHKRYQARPTLADGDGPVAEYRRWFAQFYSTWCGRATADQEVRGCS